MKKKFRSIIALVLAILLGVSVMFSAIIILANAAESSAQIQDKINALQADAKEIEKKRAELEKQIAATQQSTLTTIEKKSQLDQRIELTRLEIQNTGDQIKEYNLLIAETQKKLDAGIAEQEEMNRKYKARLRAMEENGPISYWAILFKARSFSDLIDRIAVIGEIAAADQAMLKQMEKKNAEIAVLREEVEADRTEMLKKSEKLASLEESLLKQNADAGELLKQLAKEEASLSDSFKAMEKQEAELRSKIMAEQKRYEEALEEERRKALEEANKNNAAGGEGATNPIFRNPIAKVTSPYRISTAYGYRIHPIYGYYAMHHGIDIAVNYGTPVYAIAAGYVTIATMDTINGNYVSLTHGNGYGSVYCHLDKYVVKVNDFVAEGQLIGYVGSTGWSTGPHLHFEIHKNGASVNPVKYIVPN